METSLHAFVLEQFSATNLTYQEVADGSGVPKRTVEKIARREIEDPGVSHIEKLATFFRDRQSKATA
jgi:transcriptional regulator with XRE-family HTH domain